jgi:hypothetical protein
MKRRGLGLGTGLEGRLGGDEADVGEPAIAVRGLRKSFGAKEAVARIDGMRAPFRG